MSLQALSFRSTLAIGGIALLAILVGSLNSAVRPPNVVFFLIDDMGWSDVGYNGSEIYETPAIDRLASGGMRFTNAYAAHPACRPSRYAIMTGKFPARNVMHPTYGVMHPDEFTLAEAFREAGYRTFFAGKWHLGKAPNYADRQGFEINIAGHQKGAPASYYYPYGEKGDVRKVPGLEEGGFPGEYLTDRLTQETEGFIRAHKDEPFFVFLSHYAVHRPLEGKKEKSNYYREKIAAHHFDQEAWGSLGEADMKLRQDNPEFAAMVGSVDESVGRIIGLLDELGLTDDTIVVFSSDNGGDSTKMNRQGESTSNLPLKAGKRWLYEGGIRVPLIVKMKGVTQAGVVADSSVTGTDFYPTLLELAGIELRPKQHMDGVSFVEVLKGKPSARPPMFWDYTGKNTRSSMGNIQESAMRDGNFKLIHWKSEFKYELFDVKNDVGEIHELSHEMPERKRVMVEALTRWERETEQLRSQQPLTR